MPVTREIIRFNGQPVTLRLDDAPNRGTKSKSKVNDEIEWRYNANGRAAFYLNYEGREALIRSGAAEGDEVVIHKLSPDNWRIKVVSDAAEPPRPEARRPYGNTGNGYPQRCYADNVNPETVASQPANVAQSSNGTVTSTPLNVTSPTAKHIALCLRAALDAIADAQQYSRDKGLGITFAAEDARCIALSVYISDTRKQQAGGVQ